MTALTLLPPPASSLTLRSRTTLIAILVAGASLRLYGLHWGYPFYLHAGEEQWLVAAEKLGAAISDLHLPYSGQSVWGSVGLALTWLLVPFFRLGGMVSGDAPELRQALMLSGRTVSAFVDVLSIYLVFRLAAQRSTRGGLFAAAAYAFCLASVRESHFCSGYTIATCAGLLFVSAGVGISHRRDIPAWVVLGALLGACLSVQVALAPLALVPLLGFAGLIAHALDEGGDPRVFRLAGAAIRVRLATLVVATASFLPAIIWARQRAGIIDMAQTAFVGSVPLDQQSNHSLSFWQSQVVSIYNGALAVLVGLALLVVIICATTLVVTYTRRGPRVAYELRKYFVLPVSLCVSASVAFGMLSPAAICAPRQYWVPSGSGSIVWSVLESAGAIQPPTQDTVHFLETVPLAYQSLRVLPYVWGPPMMLLFAMGLWWAVQRGSGNRLGNMAIPAAAALLLGVAWLASWAKLSAHTVPISPLLCVLAAGWASPFLHAKWRAKGGVTRGLAIGAIAFSALWCLGYVRMFGQPDPRIQAMQAATEAAPSRSVILAETDPAWAGLVEDRLAGAGDCRLTRLHPLYLMHDRVGTGLSGDDRERKAQYLAEAEGRADFLVITDTNMRRLEALRDRFPEITRWYDDLLVGRTDFRQLGRYSKRWSVLGVTVDDSGAEPSFRYFDHPTVYVFEASVERSGTKKGRSTRPRP